MGNGFDQEDPLGILEKKKPVKQEDPLGILKKKEDGGFLSKASQIGLAASTSGGPLEFMQRVAGEVTQASKPESQRIAEDLATVKSSQGVTEVEQIDFDEDDPVKSAWLPVQNKLAQDRSKPAIESIQQTPQAKLGKSNEISELLNSRKKIENLKFNSSTEAGNFLLSKLDKSKLKLKEGVDLTQQPTIDDYDFNSVLDAMPEDNMTVGIAVNQWNEGRQAREAISGSNTIDEAALKYEQLKRSLPGKQITALSGDVPNAMKGNLVLNALNDPAFQEVIQSDPNLHLQATNEILQFPDKYPAATVRMIAEMVSKKREENGMNRAILNMPSEKITKEILDEMTASGELPEQFRKFADNDGMLLAITSQLKTPGFVENLLEGTSQGVLGIGKTIAEGTGIRDLYKSRGDKLYGELKSQYESVAFKPKGLVHNISTHGGLITGQVLPMMGGGSLLRAANLVKGDATANMIMTGLQTFGYNKDRALAEMPDVDEGTILAKATIDTGIETALANVMNDTKLARQLVGKASPNIKAVIKRFNNKEISAAASKAQVNNIYDDLLTKGAKFVKGTNKVAVTNAIEEASTEALQIANSQVFGGEDIKDAEAASRVFKVLTTSYLGTLPLGLGGGVVSVRNNPEMGNLFLEMAQNPKQYEEIIQGEAAINPEYAKDLQSKLDGLKHITDVNELLDEFGIDEKKKGKFLLLSLAEKQLKEKTQAAPDKSLAPARMMKEIEIEKENILEPKGTKELLEEFYDEDLIPKSDRELIENNETGKYEPNKAGAYLKYIAQQANNLGENWEPQEGKPPSMSQYPQQLIEEANEKWAKEITAAQPKLDFDPETHQAVTTPSMEGESIESMENELFGDESLKEVEGLPSGYGKVGVSKNSEGDYFSYYEVDFRDKEGYGSMQSGNLGGPYDSYNEARIDGERLMRRKYLKQNPQAKLPEPQKQVATQPKQTPVEGTPAGESMVGGEIDVVVNEETTKTRDDVNHTTYDIVDNGENVGTIAVNYREDLGAYVVETSKVDTPGKGIGTKAYKALISKLDKPLISDSFLTKQAEGVWEKLVKEGIAERFEEEGPQGEVIKRESKIRYRTIQSKTNENLPKADTKDKQGNLPAEEGKPTETSPPEATPPTKTVAEGEGEGIGLAHADTEKIYEESGLPLRMETPTKHREQLDKEADERLAKGYDFDKVAKETMEGGYKFDDADQTLFARKVADLKAKQKDVDIKSPEFDALQAEIETLSRAADVAGTIGGRFLESRKRTVPVEETISDYVTREKEEAGVGELTEKQKETVEKEFTDITETEAVLKERIQILEEENAKLLADQEVKSVAKKAKKEKKDFKKEREEIFQSIRDKLKKARQDTSVTIVPYAKELIAIAPDVAKLVKNLTEQGITELAEIAKNIHDQLKDDIKGLQEKDIIDLIAGKYNQKRKTRSELAEKRHDLRTEAKLMNKLEALLKGEEPKSEGKKIKRNQAIKKLQDEIQNIKSFEKELTKQKDEVANERAKKEKETEAKLTKAEKEIDTAELKEENRKEKEAEAERKRIEKEAAKKTPYERAIATRRKKIEAETKEVEYQLKTGDFDKMDAPKKPPLKLDPETKELRDKLMQLKQKRDTRLMLLARSKEGSRETALRTVAEIANIPRTLMTIGDFSALLRQNIFFSAGHPIRTLKQTPDMFKAFASQKTMDSWMNDLRESPDYEVMKNSKLAITEALSHDLSVREEAFMSTLAEKIPLIGQTLRSKTGKPIIPGLNIVKGSERSYTLLLNKARVEAFRSLSAPLKERGITYNNSPRVYKALAEYINNATGRSDFGKTLNRIAPILNTVFFSPRLIASRINMLTYWAQPRFWRTLPYEARVDYFRNWMSLLITGTTILGLAQMAGADVEDDPRSSDFGKIKSGDTRWDIWGGAQPYIRVLAQMTTGQRKSTNTGKMYKLGADEPFGETRLETGLDFFRNKLAPVPGMGIDLLSGRTTIGDKVVWEWGGDHGHKTISIDDYITQRILPMTATGTAEAWKDQGAKVLLTVMVPNIFGVGTQTYSSPNSKTRERPNPDKSKREKPSRERVRTD